MDYINYVKEKPFTGYAGFGGGAGSFQFHSGSSTALFGDRAVNMGGQVRSSNTFLQNIDYFNIANSTGNASDFGDLTANQRSGGAASNGSRAVYNGAQRLSVDFITFATLSNASDFGDVTANSPNNGPFQINCVTDSNRVVWGGGGWYPSPGRSTQMMACASIAVPSNITAISGDLTQARTNTATASNATRGVLNSGQHGQAPTYRSNVIDYVTIATAGNATDFGDNLQQRDESCGTFGETRGLFHGGVYTTGGGINEYNGTEYIVMDTTSNAFSFGSLNPKSRKMQGASNATRATFSGGEPSPNSTATNERIQTVVIMTTGNASDFGNLTSGGGEGRRLGSGCSGD